MPTVSDLLLPDGRTVRVHDSGEPGDAGTVVWHHGSPQTGALLPPLLDATAARGLRLVCYARPSYRGSTPHVGRDVASAAADVEQVADALGLDRFAVMGASGGGPHALACAALLTGRVTAGVCLAGIAPLTGSPGWFDGMAAPGGLRAALGGRAARLEHARADEFDPSSFTATDWATLEGPWASLGDDAQAAGADGPDGLVDDDVAFVRPWGFDLGEVDVPVLLVQGAQDRVVPAAHAHLLADALPRVELWERPGDGHISVLTACPDALDWLIAR